MKPETLAQPILQEKQADIDLVSDALRIAADLHKNNEIVTVNILKGGNKLYSFSYAKRTGRLKPQIFIRLGSPLSREDLQKIVTDYWILNFRDAEKNSK